jgi:4-amino-4-deoxy-L-arabinose transferase-like glycosyltransferase
MNARAMELPTRSLLGMLPLLMEAISDTADHAGNHESRTMLTKRQAFCFFAVLLLAIGVRVIAAVVIDRYVTSQGRQFLIEGDANGYWELGRKIAAGEEYAIYTPPRQVLRTPGFPLLLAVCIKLFGNNLFAASLVMACVGTGCCWLTAMLARRVTDDETALHAMLIVAVSPLQIGSNVQILSETWFSFGLLLTLIATAPVLAGVGNRLQSLRSAFVSGLLTGFTVLVRPGWILWPWLSSLLVLVFGRQSPLRRLWLCALVFGGCYLALLPWGWRNHNVTGHWVFTSLWSGASLYDGLHLGATGESDMTFVDQETVYTTMSEYDANEHYKQRAFEFVAANPWRTLELAVVKAVRYLSPTLNAAGFSGGPFSLFCLVWYAVFWGLVILGAINLRNKRAILCLLLAPFLQFLVVHMVFVGSIRYRLPVEFPLSVIAARGWIVLRRKLKRDQAGFQQTV